MRDDKDHNERLDDFRYGDFCRMALPAGVYVVKSAKITLKVTK